MVNKKIDGLNCLIQAVVKIQNVKALKIKKKKKKNPYMVLAPAPQSE